MNLGCIAGLHPAAFLQSLAIPQASKPDLSSIMCASALHAVYVRRETVLSSPHLWGSPRPCVSPLFGEIDAGSVFLLPSKGQALE